MLHDPSMEAQANDIARGAGHVDISRFSMPAAAGAPVQGFLDFIFNRKRYEENKRQKTMQQAQDLVSQMDSNDPQFARAMGKTLANFGFKGTAVFDPDKHATLFQQATGTQSGNFRKPYWSEKSQVTATELERELGSFPFELVGPNKRSKKMYGISQKELDAASSLDVNAYRRLIQKANCGAGIAAKMDWTRMSDEKFVRNFTKIKALSRLAVVGNQASSLIDADKDLEKGSEKDKDMIDELQDTSDLMNPLTTYAEMRLRGIAGDRDQGRASNVFVKGVEDLSQKFRKNHAAREKKRAGFFTKIFKSIFGGW
jgi:hypothetical protein